MIPPKTLEQMAEEFAHGFHKMGLADLIKANYLAGAKAALSLPEVRDLREALRLAIQRMRFTDAQGLILAHAAFDRLMAEVGE